MENKTFISKYTFLIFFIISCSSNLNNKLNATGTYFTKLESDTFIQAIKVTSKIEESKNNLMHYYNPDSNNELFKGLKMVEKTLPNYQTNLKKGGKYLDVNNIQKASHFDGDGIFKSFTLDKSVEHFLIRLISFCQARIKELSKTNLWYSRTKLFDYYRKYASKNLQNYKKFKANFKNIQEQENQDISDKKISNKLRINMILAYISTFLGSGAIFGFSSYALGVALGGYGAKAAASYGGWVAAGGGLALSGGAATCVGLATGIGIPIAAFGLYLGCKKLRCYLKARRYEKYLRNLITYFCSYLKINKSSNSNLNNNHPNPSLSFGNNGSNLNYHNNFSNYHHPSFNQNSNHSNANFKQNGFDNSIKIST